jgi:hypothetical protein
MPWDLPPKKNGTIPSPSMAISGTDLLEVPTIRPIFQAYVYKGIYPQFIWPKIWYVYVPTF